MWKSVRVDSLRGCACAESIQRRTTEEAALQAFIQAEPALAAQYGTVLDELASAHVEIADALPVELHLDQLRSACQAFGNAFFVYDASMERQKPDLEREVAYMDRNWNSHCKRSEHRSAIIMRRPTRPC